MTEVCIPEGFQAQEFTPYSTHIGPLLYKEEVNEAGLRVGWVGLLVNERHIGGNERGHGGLLLTLLDEALGINAAFQRDQVPVVTVSMQTQFFGATKAGEFLMATGTLTKATGTMAFMEGRAWSGDRLVGSASGVWKYLTNANYKMPGAASVA